MAPPFIHVSDITNLRIIWNAKVSIFFKATLEGPVSPRWDSGFYSTTRSVTSTVYMIVVTFKIVRLTAWNKEEDTVFENSDLTTTFRGWQSPEPYGYRTRFWPSLC